MIDRWTVLASKCPQLFINCNARRWLGREFKRNVSLWNTNRAKCSQKTPVKGPPWKILFFGTDQFALESLKPLCAKFRTHTLISSLGVVSKPGSQVRKFAEVEKLLVYDWPIPDESVRSQFDLGMVVSFGALIPKHIIDALPLGCINVHASLLPRWRGAAPIPHAIINGDTETGVTIMRIHPHKFDVGEIVRQYRVAIGSDETATELERRLSVCGAEVLMECLRDLPRSIQMATPQPTNGVTYAPKITAGVGHIDWEGSSAAELYNLYRGLHGVQPLTTLWAGIRLKIHALRVDREETVTPSAATTPAECSKSSALAFLNDAQSDGGVAMKRTSGVAGLLKYDKKLKLLRVACGDGRCVLVDRLAINKKTISGHDFYNGFLSKENDTTKWRFYS